MTKKKTKVTVIGRLQAKEGNEFIYEGTVPACRGCKVKKTCHNLVKGRRYRIVAVRDNEHACKVHEKAAVVIEVEEAPFLAFVKTEMAVPDLEFKYTKSCTKTHCQSYDLCNPEGAIEDEKYVISEVLGNASDICERGLVLKLVEILPAGD